MKTGLTEGPSRPKRQIPPSSARKKSDSIQESGFFLLPEERTMYGKMRANVKRKKSSVPGASEDMKKYALLQ